MKILAQEMYGSIYQPDFFSTIAIFSPKQRSGAHRTNSYSNNNSGPLIPLATCGIFSALLIQKIGGEGQNSDKEMGKNFRSSSSYSCYSRLYFE